MTRQTKFSDFIGPIFGAAVFILFVMALGGGYSRSRSEPKLDAKTQASQGERRVKANQAEIATRERRAKLLRLYSALVDDRGAMERCMAEPGCRRDFAEAVQLHDEVDDWDPSALEDDDPPSRF